jgi:hypothetical protein
MRLCTLNLNVQTPFVREPLLIRGFISADKVREMMSNNPRLQYRMFYHKGLAMQLGLLSAVPKVCVDLIMV